MVIKIVDEQAPDNFELFDSVKYVHRRINTEIDDFEVNLGFMDSKRDDFGVLLNKNRTVYIMNDEGKTIEKVNSQYQDLRAM